MSAATMQQEPLPAYRQPVEAVLAALGTDARCGLSQSEARAWLERYGKNEFERLLVFTKGAPDVLLARCSRELVGEDIRSLSDARRAEILTTDEGLAREALRTLGIAARCRGRHSRPTESMSASSRTSCSWA
jgi:magnesium-transporting ATPase (P-type)